MKYLFEETIMICSKDIKRYLNFHCRPNPERTNDKVFHQIKVEGRCMLKFRGCTLG